MCICADQKGKKVCINVCIGREIRSHWRLKELMVHANLTEF